MLAIWSKLSREVKIVAAVSLVVFFSFALIGYTGGGGFFGAVEWGFVAVFLVGYVWVRVAPMGSSSGNYGGWDSGGDDCGGGGFDCGD